MDLEGLGTRRFRRRSGRWRTRRWWCGGGGGGPWTRTGIGMNASGQDASVHGDLIGGPIDPRAACARDEYGRMMAQRMH